MSRGEVDATPKYAMQV